MKSKDVNFRCLSGSISWPCTNDPVGRNPHGQLACPSHGGDPTINCVIDAFVDYNEDYANTPTLKVLLLREPDFSDVPFTKKESIYYREKDGVARFMSYSGPSRGYGGRKLEVTLDDGTTETHIGGWSSSAGAVNSLGFGPVMDVDIAYLHSMMTPTWDGLEVFRRGFTFMSGHITQPLIDQALHCCQGVGLIWQWTTLIPVKLGGHNIIGTMQTPGSTGNPAESQLDADQLRILGA